MNIAWCILIGGFFTPSDTPGGSGFTRALGINDNGQIVGFKDPIHGGLGYLLSSGTFTDVSTPAFPFTIPEGINNSGSIAGRFNIGPGSFHGFLDSGGSFSSFDVPGAIFTQGFGINSAGKIVGQFSNTSNTASNGEQGFLLSGGVFSTI